MYQTQRCTCFCGLCEKICTSAQVYDIETTYLNAEYSQYGTVTKVGGRLPGHGHLVIGGTLLVAPTRLAWHPLAWLT